MSQTPTVYFIDDSATMREVIKIAFRRENINVVACHDAASALTEIANNVPDIVISDVIMPDKDGYEVCQFIKQHPRLSKTPVILMSGVVNRTVAEKAFAVKADELIRKPFQPQDLITRVKHLLGLPGAPSTPPSPEAASAALSSIFATSTSQSPQPTNGGAVRTAPPRPASPAAASPPAPSPLAPAFASATPTSVQPAAAPALQRSSATITTTRTVVAGSPAEVHRLKLEITRLEILVKKLQSDLEAERQYSRALEEHVKTLQEGE
jgi:CheY-like chemotaxis protein